MSDEQNLTLSKISSLLVNQINESIMLVLVSKSETKLTSIRFNTLLFDGDEYIMSQIYTDDLFKDFIVGDTIILNKFIILNSEDEKGSLELNKSKVKIDSTGLSIIEKAKKNISYEIKTTKLDFINDFDSSVVKSFNNIEGIIMNKNISYPNGKQMVKYDLFNDSYDMAINLIAWRSDIVLEENYSYKCQFINIVKYNNGQQLSPNCFSQFEKIKKITKTKFPSTVLHLCKNNIELVLFSSEEMFNQYSNGKIVGGVINCIKKKEHQYSFKVLAIMDGKSRMYYMTAFDKSNLFPFISFNEKDVDKKMHTIMGKEKTFSIAVKKTK